MCLLLSFLVNCKSFILAQGNYYFYIKTFIRLWSFTSPPAASSIHILCGIISKCPQMILALHVKTCTLLCKLVIRQCKIECDCRSLLFDVLFWSLLINYYKLSDLQGTFTAAKKYSPGLF